MFVLGTADKAKVSVSFETPVDGSTRKQKADFVAEFKIQDHETHKDRRRQSAEHNMRLASTIQQAMKDRESPIISDEDLDEAFLREDLIGLEGIRNAEGEVPYSKDLVDQVLRDRYSRAALLKAHQEFCEQPEKVRRKN